MCLFRVEMSSGRKPLSKSYALELEISGPVALWARPDTMPNPVSYVAPTYSAVKGILEAVLRWENVEVRPVACEICRPVQFHRYAFNYGGPLRKSYFPARQIMEEAGTLCKLGDGQ